MPKQLQNNVYASPSNIVRAGLFVLMLVMLFGWVGGRRGFVLYHPINPFNLFDVEFESRSKLFTIIAALVLGLATYRPFCQSVCPFGLVSWFALCSGSRGYLPVTLTTFTESVPVNVSP